MKVTLKAIDGTKKVFPSMKEMFRYLEAQMAKTGVQPHNYLSRILTEIGDKFESRRLPSHIGFRDVRNPVCCLSERSYALSTPLKRVSLISTGASLASRNKYIVLDDKGRVISKHLIQGRYKQRNETLHVRKRVSRYSSSMDGTKFVKNWPKRVTKLYAPISFNGDEARAFTSMDADDALAKVRPKRRETVMCLWLRDYDYENFSHNTRSWKQSRKRRQWM